jgi:predicted ATPase
MSRAYLLTDNWNDWFEFQTLYDLVYFDSTGARRDIGPVKIGSFDMAPENSRPPIPDSFETLSNRFFSVGQDASYYESLNRLGVAVRDEILRSLRDMATDLSIFEAALGERVTRQSLLRSVSKLAVLNQFHRMALGGAKLSRYQFSYTIPRSKPGAPDAPTLTFDVIPESNPPTNIHVLIGRNGVGKTRVLEAMTDDLLRLGSDAASRSGFRTEDASNVESPFASLVSVTFSAFDHFQARAERKDNTKGLRYSYVGLKRTPEAGQLAGRPKSIAVLSNEFVKSLTNCLVDARSDRWKQALTTLEADPIFKDAEISELAEAPTTLSEEFKKEAKGVFSRLSSGHGIVLLTMTRLVETVEERSIVLLDEPETHLHPPLLAAFIRALSNLLIDRNGVALIATHSPVILQEVPRSCVWKLRRSRTTVKADRPEIETFGENVGILTREVFGLEVTQAGFHRLIREAVEAGDTFDALNERFGNSLGAEGRAIGRALIQVRDSKGEDSDAKPA